MGSHLYQFSLYSTCGVLPMLAGLKETLDKYVIQGSVVKRLKISQLEVQLDLDGFHARNAVMWV